MGWSWRQREEAGEGVFCGVVWCGVEGGRLEEEVVEIDGEEKRDRSGASRKARGGHTVTVDSDVTPTWGLGPA